MEQSLLKKLEEILRPLWEPEFYLVRYNGV
jgi:hypothetical protein